MGHIIHNTIRVYCIDTVNRARFIDWLCKRNCLPCGSGIGDRGTIYLIYDANAYLPLVEEWNEIIK